MADSYGGPPATYSFLVHSSSSPDASLRFENPANPKQKRRRTSPRDHAILEAAYQRNSKPDKKERAEIVDQVDLGEKEVQIWFQNRRQNDRRKSKPLQPHELIAHFRNGVPVEASPPDVRPSEPSAVCAVDQSPSTSNAPSKTPTPTSLSSSIHELLNPPTRTAPEKSGQPTQRQYIGPILTPPSSFDASQHSTVNRTLEEPSAPNPSSSAHGRKRSHEVMADTGLHETTAPTLKKSSSFVRLAMTVDGAVKVRTTNEPTPSPPKQRSLPPLAADKRNNSLARSQSDLPATIDFKDVNPSARRVGRNGFGRSRDARTWEFYCDRDSGDALETQAEAENKGSAIGAINLIRSSSQRTKTHALSPSLTKQNTRRALPEPANTKPKLSRAQSSMARLQNFGSVNDDVLMKSKRPRHERSPSGDSDKENWAPGTRASHNPLRRMHPSAPRSSVLRENDAGHRPSTTHGHPSPPANGNPVLPTEHQSTSASPAIMYNPSKAKGDDLDCIQGLLSLSQGAWR